VKIAMIIVAFFFCLPLWAEEKEEDWPSLPIVISLEASKNIVSSTLYTTTMSLRLTRDAGGKTDEVVMSFRVVGAGMSCLHKPFLLGLRVVQKPGPTVFQVGDQEIYFQVHYLTSRNSVRGYIPLMTKAEMSPTLEVERWELSQIKGTKIQLRGLWSAKEHDFGVGMIHKIGRHLELKLFTNDPQVSIGFSYNLTGLGGQ